VGTLLGGAVPQQPAGPIRASTSLRLTRPRR
jgi:hypothetical protein